MIKKLFFGGLLLLIFGARISGKEYFVAYEGNDAGSGSISDPFASLHKASHIARAGDTVTVRGGEYFIDNPILPANSGEKNNWILYRSMPGEKVIIDGRDVKSLNGKLFSSQTAGLFQITAKEYIHLKDIHFQNSYSVGILVGYASNRPGAAPEEKRNTRHIIVEGCSVDRSFNSGISVWYADSVIITNCEVTRANDLDFHLPGTKIGHEAPHEAISVCGARYFEISHNHVYDCYKEGIDIKEVSSHGVVRDNLVHDLPRQAYYADAWFGLLEDIEFKNNVAHSSAWGFVVSVEGKGSEARNIRIHHNLVYDMKGAGVLFGLWGGNGPRSDIHIYNNTFYKCGSEDWWSGNVGSIDILSTHCRDVFIYNNICDEGYDYEIGFGAEMSDIPKIMQEKNIVIKDNLLSGVKDKPIRKGQYDAIVYEFIPEDNVIGSPEYRDLILRNFVPTSVLKSLDNEMSWRYNPSSWFGAFKPVDEVKADH